MSLWQLPEGIDELTGADALRFEFTRRKLLDLYFKKGFDLVVPPMVEYASYVQSKTFKFLDSISDKMLSVHADITPQIARIDSQYDGKEVKKYCYINAILKPQADDFYATRSPIQAGAEIYGSENSATDVEVIELMLASLKLLSIEGVVLSLGNAAIFDALIQSENLSIGQNAVLRDIFRRRSIPDLSNFLDNHQLKNANKFLSLMHLEGSEEILNKALNVFQDLPQAKAAIEDLMLINHALNDKNIEVIYDLAELKAYEYHTGVVFSVYHQNYSKALAQGGRYNDIGKSFTQDETGRAATGFSFDLKFLSQTTNA